MIHKLFIRILDLITWTTPPFPCHWSSSSGFKSANCNDNEYNQQNNWVKKRQKERERRSKQRKKDRIEAFFRLWELQLMDRFPETRRVIGGKNAPWVVFCWIRIEPSQHLRSCCKHAVIYSIALRVCHNRQYLRNMTPDCTHKYWHGVFMLSKDLNRI